MAGFAILMGLILYGFAGFVLASVSAVILTKIAKKRIRARGLSESSVTRQVGLAPFAGLLWIVVAFLLHIQISNRFAHQSCEFSPDPYITLPNGYVLGSANTYDGYIKAPSVQTDVPVSGPGYVRSLIGLEWKGDYFVGSQFDFESKGPRNFVFDTRDQSFQVVPRPPESWSATGGDKHSDPDSYWLLYFKYRHRWPSNLLLAMIAAGEIGIACWVFVTLKNIGLFRNSID